MKHYRQWKFSQPPAHASHGDTCPSHFRKGVRVPDDTQHATRRTTDKASALRPAVISPPRKKARTPASALALLSAICMVDLYSGISATPPAFPLLRWCSGANPIQHIAGAPATEVSTRRGTRRHDDGNTISTLKIPLYGLLKASPSPCQPWSQANKGPSGCQGPK
jgi:hypothetical protein